MAKKATIDQTDLAMALIGYEAEKAKMDTAIADIKARLGQGRPANRKEAAVGAPAGAPARKRVMSAAARKRIAAAQRKRWAEFHKGKSEEKKPKRVLSEAGRKAIADAARKRWAAQRKAAAKKPAAKAARKSTAPRKTAPLAATTPAT